MTDGLPPAWDGLDAEWKAHSESRIREIAAQPEPDKAVVFVGDSITENFDVRTLFPETPVSNHGISADSTQGVLLRLDQITRADPDKIFVLIGTNDLHQEGKSEAAVDQGIADRIHEIAIELRDREPQATFHLIGILPRQAEFAGRIARINKSIAESADELGAIYIDLTAVLGDRDGVLREVLTYDGLHLNNEAGYPLFAEAIRPCVERGCPDGLWSRVSPVGRTVERDGVMRIGWPGSGMRFEADGDTVIHLRDSGLNQFDLKVGDEVSIYTPEAGLSRLAIPAQGEPYEVSLTRRSESYASGLTDIVLVEGDVRPVESAGPKLLFVGDSITAGFGTIGPDETCGYEIATSSVRDTYAMMAAEELGADAHIVAISGRGAVYNYDDNPAAHMLGHFDLALPDMLEAWDHDRWTPDAVVVSLGTNDFSTYDPGTTFAANYATLLYRIAAEYPNARIFAVTGPLLTDERGDAMAAGIETAVARAVARGIEVTTVPLSLAEEGHVWGCNYHPGPDSNRHMADELVAAMKAKMDI